MNETCLRPGFNVSKSDPRIAFRGALDSLEADILEAQVLAAEKKDEHCLKALGEILLFVRELMSAEVNERPVIQMKLFGLELDELQRQSRVGMTLPSYTMGALPVRLNSLRTRVREAELKGVAAFGEERNGVLHALNRLSSAVYYLFASGFDTPLLCAKLDPQNT
ncbi:MAG: hypothetical protein LBH44_02485 [Treponema sp.]|jgi:ethanolamine utilization cobalamin adenosyltransferase|nr:hypothetical protein [Treponema sp.]